MVVVWKCLLRRNRHRRIGLAPLCLGQSKSQRICRKARSQYFREPIYVLKGCYVFCDILILELEHNLPDLSFLPACLAAETILT